MMLSFILLLFPIFSCFCFRFYFYSSSNAQSPPSLWSSTLLRRLFSFSIFWLCQILQRFLDRLFPKQIYVFVVYLSLIHVITPFSPVPTSLVDNKHFSSSWHATVVVQTRYSVDRMNLTHFCVSLSRLFYVFLFFVCLCCSDF